MNPTVSVILTNGGKKKKNSVHLNLFCVFHNQTELVEGEEHDHRIISRINLVDLAGSERCGVAQTSGDRLRVLRPFHTLSLPTSFALN